MVKAFYLGLLEAGATDSPVRDAHHQAFGVVPPDHSTLPEN